MAVEGAEVDFDTWISERFRALNTDDEVFGPYIKSIVEGDETLEEKIDALDGILGELGDEGMDVEAFRKEILSRWESHRNSVKQRSAGGGEGDSNGIDSRLESILKLTETSSSREEGNNEKGLPKALGQAPDKALRAAILNQYRDDSDIDSGEDGPSTSKATREREGGGGGGFGGGGLERNTNSERVQSELKDKREREKAESAKKREKDREDRANQKKQAQERKEKAKKKATKVERKSGR